MDPNQGEDKPPKSDLNQPGNRTDDRQQPPRQPSQWIPPTTGNPDLDPAGLTQGQRIDPLIPQGMQFDPRNLVRDQNYNPAVPPGARFDPFGPPDPLRVGPGRGPMPSSQFGDPDPDHLPAPGLPPQQTSKSLKNLNPFGGPRFPPPPGGMM